MPELLASSTLSLTNLGALPKLGIKGAGTTAWLRDQGVDVPPTTYGTRPLADGGTIIRLGTGDFFLEGTTAGEVLPRLQAAFSAAPPGVYRVERQDASFLLRGTAAVTLLAQVSSFDFRTAPLDRVILTRAAGVSCTVLAGSIDAAPQFRLWVDCTYAESFGEILAQITGEFGSRLVEPAS